MKQPMINYVQNEKNDELYTPSYAVAPLLKYIGKGLTVWCPCDKEESQIVKVLKQKGYNVIHSHIDEGKDFFSYRPNEHFDAIITNPPYSIKDKIIKRCYELSKPFALLLPLTALEGVARGELFTDNIGIVVLNKRVEFLKGKTNWFNTSWFIHGFGLNQRLFFEKIDKSERN